MEKKLYKGTTLTVNWDIDNRNLILLRNIRIPGLEISFERDFRNPDIWILESEDYNYEAIYSIKDRANYFTIYFTRRFYQTIEEFSSLAMKLASQRVLLYCISDDVFYFLRKMLIIRESAGLITAIKGIIENAETESEKLVIKQHSTNVAEMSYRIATMLDEKSEDIKLAGFIHDIGKICIPASILFSDRNFNDEKIKIFQLHVLWGEVLFEKLSPNGVNYALRESIGFHHERLNGQGYLRGISKNIPYVAKIIAVSDVYTALTSDRPHRLHFDKDVAIAFITSKVGELFDPEIVEAFKRVV